MVATDNKLTAAEQSSAQAWLRHASMLVWMTDAQGIIRLLDGDALDSLEIDSALWLGRPLVELFTAYDVCPANLERALGGEQVRSLGKLKGRLLETRYSPLLDAEGAVTGVHAVSIDVTDSRRLDQVLNTVANAVSAETGDNFFKTLILQLQSALGADYAFVGALSDDQQFIHVNAACAGGEIIDNFSYSLATTPCADVVHGDLCSYPRDVHHAYPDDLLLKEMGVEGYCGAKLRNAKGESLGVLSVLYKQPMTETPLVENLLRIFSNRAAVEMERQQSAQALQSSERLHKVLSECNQALVRSDQQVQQLQQICNILVEHGGYPLVWVGSAETAEATEVVPQFFAGDAGSYLDNRSSLDRGLRRSGKCIREGREWLARFGPRHSTSLRTCLKVSEVRSRCRLFVREVAFIRCCGC
ncbi:MAG: PAS domain-containing protein [Motiliproteus sp.]